MNNEHGITCIHATDGLCEMCLEEYAFDPHAYAEYGDHPEGIARWKKLQQEINRDLADDPPCQCPIPEEDLPF